MPKKAEELVQCMNISSDALIYIKIYCAVSVEEFLKKPNPVPNEVDSRVFQGKLKGKKLLSSLFQIRWIAVCSKEN
jgi:hypothetical protein